MAATVQPESLSQAVDPAVVRRKVAWRVVPLVFVLYIVAYLDRANAGFAKLQMQEKLGFSDSVFGWGFGLFFAGYLLLEIPGALIVEHWSARKWFARILLTWGVCSMSMALVRTPLQFYVARFLLGVAEAGFFPGIIVYFTHWFPRADRARALAGMVLAIPVSLSSGSYVSKWLLEVGWMQLDGWQWLFVMEGLPAVLLGAAVPFLMTDRPAQARWLTQCERDWLEQTLDTERAEAARIGGTSLSAALKQPAVWYLALGIFVANTGGYALVFWLPTAVQGLLKETGAVATNHAVLAWTGLAYLCGLAGVWVSGQSSDRLGERKWHCALGMMLAGMFLFASGIPGQSWTGVFVWLCLTVTFGYSWPPPFWVLPTSTLSASAAAVSVGFINICANVAGLVGSPTVGLIRSADWEKLVGAADAASWRERACLAFLASCLVGGGLIICRLRMPGRTGLKGCNEVNERQCVAPT